MKVEDAINLVIVEKLKGLIVANNMVATGALLNSVRVEKSERLGIITYDIIALDYIEDLNYGVAPKSSPDFKNFDQDPRISKLQEWLDAKGLDLNPFGVRANILKFGTSWYRAGGSNIVTDCINPQAFSQVIALAADDIKGKIRKTTQVMYTQPAASSSDIGDGFIE